MPRYWDSKLVKMDETQNKRILIITDSLALPRSKPEVTLYEDTYPYLLQKKYRVLQLSYGGGTIKEIVHQAHYYLSFNPDFIILQSGIVDCAYRAFPLIIDKGSLYSKTIDIYRTVVAKLLNPKKLRRVFRFRYTKPQEFQNTLTSLKDDFPNTTLIAIGIVQGSIEYEKKVPGISDSIKCYNNLLIEAVGSSRFVDLTDMSPECVMSDCHHINKKGHLYIYNRLITMLD